MRGTRGASGAASSGASRSGGVSGAPPAEARPFDGPHTHIDLLAHSFGANVALAIARRRPHHVRHLHLLAPGGASAATFSSITSPPDFGELTPRVRALVGPPLAGIFASANFLNLLFSPS